MFPISGMLRPFIVKNGHERSIPLFYKTFIFRSDIQYVLFAGLHSRQVLRRAVRSESLHLLPFGAS